MSYEVTLTSSAQKDLDGFRGKLLTRFENIILALMENPRPTKARKLVGGGSKWRIRAGDYRILYAIDDKLKNVTVYRIAHRREVYR